MVVKTLKTLVYLKIISALSHGIKSWRWWSNLLGFLEVKVQLSCLKKKRYLIISEEAKTLTCVIIFQSWQVKCPRWCHQSCTDHVSVRPWTNTSSWSLITGRVLGSTADGARRERYSWKWICCSLMYFAVIHWKGEPSIICSGVWSWVKLNLSFYAVYSLTKTDVPRPSSWRSTEETELKWLNLLNPDLQ